MSDRTGDGDRHATDEPHSTATDGGARREAGIDPRSADSTTAPRSAQPPSAGERWMSLDEIRGVYDEHVDRMERIAPINRLLTGRFRRDFFGRAEGRVLDVACGMGINREYVPETTEYVGIDLSPAMLARAEQRHDDLARGETLLEMDAQDLSFEADSFETVISSLSTCTFPDPVAALREMERVCAPGGRILLVEHGRSDVGPLARLQDWRADAHYETEGCRWNQEPLDLVEAAGLDVRDAETGLLGIVTAIEARPGGE